LPGEPAAWWPVSHHSGAASLGHQEMGHQADGAASLGGREMGHQVDGVASLGRRRWSRPERQLEAEWAASGQTCCSSVYNKKEMLVV